MVIGYKKECGCCENWYVVLFVVIISICDVLKVKEIWKKWSFEIKIEGNWIRKIICLIWGVLIEEKFSVNFCN